jgi:dUTP pyrophosphatase
MIKLLKGIDFPGAPADELQRQPAGYDLTARSVDRFSSPGQLDLTNKRRQLPELESLPWPKPDARGEPRALRLKPGGYLVTYNEEIGIPSDCAGIVLPRSSLMRCGATLHSALWDPGYRGRGQGLLTVHNDLDLLPDARIGQLILIALEQEADQLYTGSYQGENL